MIERSAMNTRRPPSRRLAATLGAVMALLASGCGGPSPDERLAESVCTTTLTWAERMLGTYDEARLTRAAPGNDSLVILSGLALRGKGDAMTFASDLRAVPVPDTDAGRQVRRSLEDAGNRTVEVMSELERYVRTLPESVTLLQSIRGLQRLESDLVTVVLAMKAVPDPIKMLVPELREAFESADSCKALEAVGTD